MKTRAEHGRISPGSPATGRSLFGDIGDLDAARKRHLESAEAHKKAGSPAVNVIGSELEALRIDIMQGRAAEALPQVEERLAQVEDWWQRHRSGHPVPEAPDPEDLARTLIGALDIANDADRALNDWKLALGRTDAVLEVTASVAAPGRRHRPQPNEPRR